MIHLTNRVSGDEVDIFYPESADDISGFRDFISRNTGRVLALDTETTGLNIYSFGFACRLVQIGTDSEAWVLRADRFSEEIRSALSGARKWVAHNAPFDLLVLDRSGLAPLSDLGPRVFDTYILAHLCDPRMEHDGGPGLSLKPLSRIYVDPDAVDTQTGLYEVFRKEYKATKSTGWALIDIDHPVYIRYAGLDVIYASRLLKELGTLIRGNNLSNLAAWEHRLQLITTAMQRRGLRIDPVYTRELIADLSAEGDIHRETALRYGVNNVNSTAQVIAALEALGEQWSARTGNGKPSVNKDTLLPMADLDSDWNRIGRREPNPVADAVVRAKRAKAWAGTYGQAFLDLRDENDRIHPSIKSLAARTARMSISNPPLQQLPSSDWTIRRAIVADPGHLIVAADYAQVEMRVLAAIAKVKEMIVAIRSGESIHERTANLLWPDGYEKWQYKIAKNTGFAKVYGGGAATIARTSGSTLDEVKPVISAYDNAFPEIRTYGRALQREAMSNGGRVVTPIGRLLPLDRDRAYAATNYVVQSTARDILGKALIAIDDAGLSEHILIPVHDELIAQAPEADAEDFVREMGRLMETTFRGVFIASDPEVYGPSWGHGYGAPS